MSPFKRPLWLLSRGQLRPFARDYDRIVQGPEKSIDSDSDDGLARPQQSEPLLSEDGYQAKSNIVTGGVKSGKLILFITAMAFLASLSFDILMRVRVDRACQALMEPWSPLTDLVEYEWRQFDSENCPYEYCGAPSREREDAWTNLWDLGWMIFPRDRISTLNKSPSDSWLHQVHPMNEDSLVGLPEVIHQLHCIGLIREAIYRNQFDFTGYINTSRIEFDLHVNHCLLALKLIIECKADSGPVILEEVEEADESSQISAWKLRDPPKKCRRFKPLRDWYETHTICSSSCNAPEIYNGEYVKHID